MGTVSDAIAIARRGRPVAALITERFWAQSALVARSAGMPDVPRVSLPYPIAGTGAAVIERTALDAVPAVLEALGLTS